MPNYLKRPAIINPNAYKKGRIGILVQDEFDYWKHFNRLIEHHKDLIAKVLPDHKFIPLPIGTDYLEAYLSGFALDYHPFENTDSPDLEGFRLEDPNDPSHIHVYFNTNCSLYRQRFTQIHETLHICQMYDSYLLDYLDWLLQNPAYTKEVVGHLKERVTDKVVGMYMMPEKYFREKYIENPEISFLSEKFHASAEAIKIRLQELGLPNISKIQ